MRARRSSADLLTLATENTEMRLQLAEAREPCIELAVDAGELHAKVQTLGAKLAQVEADRDVGRSGAERHGTIAAKSSTEHRATISRRLTSI